LQTTRLGVFTAADLELNRCGGAVDDWFGPDRVARLWPAPFAHRMIRG